MAETYINDLTPFKVDKRVVVSAINKHLTYDVPRIRELHKYYKAKHDILERPDRPNKPNNKLVCSHPSKITDTAIAYFLGNPVNILDDDIDVQEALTTILKNNDFDDLLLEVGKECSIAGKSGLLVYQNEEGLTNLMQIPAEELFYITDTKRKKVFTARIYSLLTEFDVNVRDDIYAVEIYTDKEIYYMMYDGDLVPDARYEEPIVTHIFKANPLVVFQNNKEEQGDFEKVIGLIDAYDKLMSDTSNEHEAYRNAYLMLKNLMMTPEASAALSAGGTIEVGEDGDAKFITKTIQDTAITAHLNKLQEDIHNFTDIPNMSDQSFAQNLSGVNCLPLMLEIA